jgi:hypothetical protein
MMLAKNIGWVEGSIKMIHCNAWWQLLCKHGERRAHCAICGAWMSWIIPLKDIYILKTIHTLPSGEHIYVVTAHSLGEYIVVCHFILRYCTPFPGEYDMIYS